MHGPTLFSAVDVIINNSEWATDFLCLPPSGQVIYVRRRRPSLPLKALTAAQT